MAKTQTPSIGWIRVAKSKAGNIYYKVSLDIDGKKIYGSMFMDKEKLAEAKALLDSDPEGSGKIVVGNIKPNTPRPGQGAASGSTFKPRPKAQPNPDADEF